MLNKKGRHRDAFAWYAAALTNGVADAYTHFALAYTADTWLDDAETARRHYAVVTAEGTKSMFQEQAFGDLGRLLGLSGDSDGAISTLTRGLSAFPHSIVLHHNISVAYRAKGLHRMASMHRQEAERLRRSEGEQIQRTRQAAPLIGDVRIRKE